MFKLIRHENAVTNVAEPVMLEATANEAISNGEALVLSSGKLTKCSPTTKPTHIAMTDLAATATERNIAVYRITSDMVFRVPVMAAPTALKPGDKVTLHADALQVTSTTTSGVVTVESLDGAITAADELLVRIV